MPEVLAPQVDNIVGYEMSDYSRSGMATGRQCMALGILLAIFSSFMSYVFGEFWIFFWMILCIPGASMILWGGLLMEDKESFGDDLRRFEAGMRSRRGTMRE